MIRLRLLGVPDLPFADQLRELAGWNQTVADWRRFLDLESEGCFLAEWNGAPAGTVTTLIHSPQLAWVGMVLVHPEYRRRGIGRALLEGALEYLGRRGVACVGLDATPLGEPVYAALGFRRDFTLSRWEHRGWSKSQSVDLQGLREWAPSDQLAAVKLDTRAFGVGRVRLLAALASASRASWVSEAEAGKIDGFGMVRAGARAAYLGPVVATQAANGIRLVAALLAHAGSGPVYWDIPEDQQTVKDWAEAQGFVRQRSLTRMFRGECAGLGVASMQIALSAPETG